MADLVRVGEKVISRAKLVEAIDRILDLRFRGMSQQEVADKLQVDRTFISRLESLGEIRKGGTVALVGFPVRNKAEVERVAREEGVDFILLMTERERRDFIEKRSGLDLFNDVMQLAAQVRQHDAVVLLGSDKRIRILAALLDREVIPVEIGKSPIEEDKYVDPEALRAALRAVR